MSENPTTSRELYDRKLDRLFQDGTLVQVNVGVWTMRTALREDDLELADGFKLPESFSLGAKLLLPQVEHDRLKAVAAETSQFMQSNAWEFPIARAHFVPNKRLQLVLDKLQELEAKFRSRVASLVERYPALRDAWLAKCTPAQAAKLLPMYPSPANLASRFRYDVIMFEVSMPKHMRQVELPELQAREGIQAEMRAKHRAAVEAMASRNVARLDEFVQQAINGVRLELLELFRTMGDKLRRGEVLQPASIGKLRRVIATFVDMDFTANEELHGLLTPLLALLDTGKDFQEDIRAVQQLKASIKEVTGVVEQLSDVDAQTGAYFRSIAD